MSARQMDRLWAPWRITYISGARSKRKKSCIFCDAKAGRKDYVLFKTRLSAAMLNIYPYNNGHTMVAPLRHVGDLRELTPGEALELFSSCSRVMKVLDRVLRPQGYNIGVNVGLAAGAGIPGHLHVHIVPAGAATRTSCRCSPMSRFCLKRWPRPIASCARVGRRHDGRGRARTGARRVPGVHPLRAG
jgi:ATP adenylyltransferase